MWDVEVSVDIPHFLLLITFYRFSVSASRLLPHRRFGNSCDRVIVPIGDILLQAFTHCGFGDGGDRVVIPAGRPVPDV